MVRSSRGWGSKGYGRLEESGRGTGRITIHPRPRQDLATTGRSAAAAGSRHSGTQFETGAHRGVDEVDVDRLRLCPKGLFDDEGQAVVFENLVVFVWLIQSHTQRGTRSPTLHHRDAHG